jgi:hypothetical protein
MKQIQLLSLITIICCLFIACTKDEIIYQNEHINVVIEDNEAPPYSGITSIQIESYINRLYIDLLGREPTVSERMQARDYLKSNNLTATAREFVLNQLMATNEYHERFFTIQSGELLNGINTQDINNAMAFYTLLYNNATTANNILLMQFYQNEINRLTNLDQAISNYSIGQISINDFFASFINNPFFDDINMGSENFVIGSFEGLFKRLPTSAELAAGIQMVDGFSAQLLQKDGSGKGDFIDIMTTTPEFYQGLTINIYRQLLARDPNSQEMNNGTLSLSANGDYQLLQKEVLKSDEYARF